MRELLKEARGIISHILKTFKLTENECAQANNVLVKLDAYLAEPALDAMGLVEKIRGFSACILARKPSMRTDNDPGEVGKISTDWMLSDTEAVALIESYAKQETDKCR